MTFNSFTPIRLQAAKAALAAAAITTSAAVGAGVMAPSVSGVLAAHTEKQELIGDIRQLTADIQLAADSNNIVGVYTAGALFDILAIFGLGDPVDALKTLAEVIGGPGISDAVNAFIDTLLKFGPLDVGRVSGYREMYDRVNGLGYSSDALANIIGIDPSDPIYEEIKDAAGPMINQRRAVIVAESTGGTDAARAMRQMIDTVQAGSPAWGGDPSNPTFVNPGVTAVVALMVRNPSRPGGGVWGLINPLTSIFGADLMNPDLAAPGYGSFISRDRKQVLNLSFTDLAYKYDWVSDIPSSINPFSWLNTAVGAILPTYLIPDKDYLPTALLDLTEQLVPGGINAGTTVLDPSGGVGPALAPGFGDLLDLLYQIAPEIVGPFIEALQLPGKATYATYDSGNLPLVEPLAVLPRLLSYLGVDLPTPITNLLTTVLQPLVDAGYNDARIAYAADGTPSLVRTGDLGHVPTDLLRSPMSAVDGLRMPQIVFNAVMLGIAEHVLSPEKYTLKIGDLDLSGIYRNVITLTIAHALRDVVDNIRLSAAPVFESIAVALEPIAAALDEVQTGVNQTRYDFDNEFRGLVGADPASTPNPAPGSDALRVEAPAPAPVQLPVLEEDPAPAEAVSADTGTAVPQSAAAVDAAVPVSVAPVEVDPVEVAPVDTPVEVDPVEVAPADTPVEVDPVEVAPADDPVEVAPVEEIDVDVPDTSVADTAEPVRENVRTHRGGAKSEVSATDAMNSAGSTGSERGAGSSDRSSNDAA